MGHFGLQLKSSGWTGMMLRHDQGARRFQLETAGLDAVGQKTWRCISQTMLTCEAPASFASQLAAVSTV